MDYKSQRWKRLRERVLRRERFQCQECKRYNPIPVDATVAHHVWPADDYPDLQWQGWNLIALCATCHDKMHDRITREITETGEAWQRRVSPPPPEGPVS